MNLVLFAVYWYDYNFVYPEAVTAEGNKELVKMFKMLRCAMIAIIASFVLYSNVSAADVVWVQQFSKGPNIISVPADASTTRLSTLEDLRANTGAVAVIWTASDPVVHASKFRVYVPGLVTPPALVRGGAYMLLMPREGTIVVHSNPNLPSLSDIAAIGNPQVAPALIIEGSDVTVTQRLRIDSAYRSLSFNVQCRLDGLEQTKRLSFSPSAVQTDVVFAFHNVQPDATDAKQVVVTLDSSNEIEQSNKNNDVATIRVSAPRPDYAMGAITFSPVSPVSGQQVTADITVTGQHIGIGRNLNIQAIRVRDNAVVSTGSVSIPVGTNTTGHGTVTFMAEYNNLYNFFINCPSLVTETTTSNNGASGNLVVRPSPLPNLRIVDVSITPSTPRQDETVTVVVSALAENITVSQVITTEVLTRGNETTALNRQLAQVQDGVPVGTLVPLQYTLRFNLLAQGSMPIRVKLDSTNAIAETTETDNVWDTTLTFLAPPGPQDDFSVVQRGAKWYGVLANVDRHLGEVRKDNVVVRRSDLPAALSWNGAGQQLTVSTSGTVEFEIDTAIAGDHRIGLTFSGYSGPMFLVPSTFVGSPYLKPTGSTSGSQTLCYRVRSTPQGRTVTTVVDAFVRVRPYVVGSDPGNIETTRPADLTDLYVDPIANKLVVGSVTAAHLVAPVTPNTTSTGLVLFDPTPGSEWDLTQAITTTYDLPHDQMSVDLSGLTTSVDHKIRFGFAASGQRVFVEMFSFGRKARADTSTEATHSLVSNTEPIVRLRWNPATKCWGSAR